MTDNNDITTYLKTRLPLISDETIRQFRSIITYKKIPKGETLLGYGKISTICYIIKTGYIASFIRHDDGSDFIRTIYKKFSEIASLQSLIANQKSNATYKTLTECEVYELDFRKFASFNTLDFKNLHIKILEKVYMDSEKRINELSALDATQRYTQLRKDIPKIDHILPQYQIANYLNITPVQLSRIRRKIILK